MTVPGTTEVVAPAGASVPATMRAAVRERYCDATRVELRTVETPAPAAREVLVRVHAASLNLADWYGVVGRPWLGRLSMGLRRPKIARVGGDFAGVVAAIGAEVIELRPGDEVLGVRTGALAEYVAANVDRLVARKPATASFEQAACVPIAGLTALQGLRDRGGVQPGQRVLINGASGGVGTLAVQVAKALGAQVTGVCSTRNVELVRALGADRVLDYTSEDFTRTGDRYDVVLDVAGSRPWRALRRVLAPDGSLVLVGGPRTNRLLGPLGGVVAKRIGGALGRRRVTFFVAKVNRADLEVLAGWLAEGKLTPAVDRRYDLDRVGEALAYLGEGHCRSKIVIIP
ncbi:MAG TPA: NAD(P)-dependent alcohol dehydrogenase [Gaiellaceae bacterium]|nr:NAD(P)-dependent alcohol dehydrogenase [Gaiellaceae bacterium]